LIEGFRINQNTTNTCDENLLIKELSQNTNWNLYYA